MSLLQEFACFVEGSKNVRRHADILKILRCRCPTARTTAKAIENKQPIRRSNKHGEDVWNPLHGACEKKEIETEDNLCKRFQH